MCSLMYGCSLQAFALCNFNGKEYVSDASIGEFKKEGNG